MLSEQNQELSDIFIYYNTLQLSLNYYRTGIEENRITDENYIGYTKNELIESFHNHLNELEKNVCLNILNAIEASFRIDYLIRAEKKYKDDTSRRFRDLYKSKERKASLEKDILNIWKQENQNIKTENQNNAQYF
ncbi:MAG: hypothetical protein GY795_21020 [Desulfobacterales bacterium]|nr:hypothetical protein [Desulfobacterales bacterium]